MKFLSGIISDRLRAKFPPGDPAWTPQRGTEPKTPKKKGVDGYPMTGRKKKQK